MTEVAGLDLKTFSDSTRLEFSPTIPINGSIGFFNIRREHTGIHAMVTISVDGVIIQSDTFNIGRVTDRDKLVRLTIKELSIFEQEAWTSLGANLLKACIWVMTQWEASSIESGEAELEPDASSFPIYPYIIKDGGTILFAPPGSGKSYLLQTMAISTAIGRSSFWQQEQAPVVYINLERSRQSVERREFSIRRALGIEGRTGVTYIHARGKSLAAVSSHVAKLVERQPNTVVMLDSLSRAGLGSLNEDLTANRFVDTMNSFGTWIAIGHTPRADSDHVYGSQHFDAGQDIGIKVSSERKDNLLGVALRITKANDIPPEPIKILVFKFADDGIGLEHIGLADYNLFPSLAVEKKVTQIETLINYVQEVGSVSTNDAAEELSMLPSYVNNQFVHSGFFQFASKEGHKVLYKVSRG